MTTAAGTAAAGAGSTDLIASLTTALMVGAAAGGADGVEAGASTAAAGGCAVTAVAASATGSGGVSVGFSGTDCIALGVFTPSARLGPTRRTKAGFAPSSRSPSEYKMLSVTVPSADTATPEILPL